MSEQYEDGITRLNRLANQLKRQKYSAPDHALVKAAYNDRTTNGLTKAIVAFFNLNGGFATRVSTTGLYREDVGGFVPGNTVKGMSDVVACLGGLFVATECKFSKGDRQSPEQKKVQQRIEQAGGVYIVARTYDDFERQILEVLKKLEAA